VTPPDPQPASPSLATSHRTHLCGALRASDVGARVKLGGWVHRNRNLGGLLFMDLRDRAGIVQVSLDPSATEAMAAAAGAGPETVVLVEGEVVARPPEMRNAEMATGEVEVSATAVRVVGPATPPAIPVDRMSGV
jgi:aspartyl-tRNA synthetase